MLPEPGRCGSFLGIKTVKYNYFFVFITDWGTPGGLVDSLAWRALVLRGVCGPSPGAFCFTKDFDVLPTSCSSFSKKSRPAI